jgi:hypothetical protein
VCLCMANLTEVFPCFILSCKANARIKPAKTGHSPHSSKYLCCSVYFCVVICIFVLFYAFLCFSMYFCVVLCIFVLSYYFCVVMCIVCFMSLSVLFVCLCILYDSHRVATQLQSNISFHNEFKRHAHLKYVSSQK